MTMETTLTPELLDQLLAGYSKPEDLTGENRLFKQLKKALIERALGAELSHHLGYEPFGKLRRRPNRTRQRQQPQRHEPKNDFD